MTANFRYLLDADWLVFGRHTALHYADLTDEQLAEMEDVGTVRAVWTVCSRWARLASIPGVSTRMFTLEALGGRSNE